MQNLISFKLINKILPFTPQSSPIKRAYNLPVSNSQTEIRSLLDPLTKIDILDE